MPKKNIFLFFAAVLAVVPFLVAPTVFSQNTVNLNALSLRQKTNLFIEPSVQTVIEGSIFDVSFFLNTNGNNINTIDLNIKFSPDKLVVVKPSAGKSLIGIWLEPPKYSNTAGTARFVGVVPNGIITESGLIITMSFKALKSGQADVFVAQSSRILANDGLGSEVPTEFGRAAYSIVPKSPEGPVVFSETHPFSDKWYNNNNPVLAWEKNSQVADFSFILDNKPFTVPDNISDGKDTIKSYQDLTEGLHYFHIKALKQGMWGATTHFLIRIDTSPPASFKPELELLTAKVIDRGLVYFFTTDALSGINHYEVGVIEKTKSPTESPVFIQAESPYQLPNILFSNLRVIVRAVDNAGNVRDESMDVEFKVPSSLVSFIKENTLIILIAVLIIVLFGAAIHYLFGHKIISRFLRALKLIKKEDLEDEFKKENQPVQ